MLGVIINAAAVFVCGILGAFIASNFASKYQDAIMKFLPLAVIILGIDSALKVDSMIMIISIIIGVIIGEFLDLEEKFDRFAKLIKDKFIKDSKSDFSAGFISGTILFCVGSMGILGAIYAGVRGDNSLLFTKVILDGLAAFFLSTSLGRGIAFSGFSILVYEGAITLLAGSLSQILTSEILNNISGVGDLTIVAIGLSMLDLVKFRLANALPAIVVSIIIGLITNLI